jgi:hypothetical protein
MWRFLLLTLFILPLSLEAASIRIVPDVLPVRVGTPVTLTVYADVVEDTVNAIDAVFVYDEALTFVDATDNDSSVLFWITYPTLCTSTTVCLSGIAPGGFTGPAHIIASLTFMPQTVGTTTVSLDPVSLLAHDGKGTAVPVSHPPLTLFVEEPLPGAIAPVTYTDTEPPEAFTPEVIADPDVYDGAYVLVFETKDKQTKIVSYYVKEYTNPIVAWFAPWRVAQSPYQLTDQSLQSFVAVKAVDEAGNERTMVVQPKTPYAIPHRYWIAVFISLLSIAMYLWYYRRR